METTNNTEKTRILMVHTASSTNEAVQAALERGRHQITLASSQDDAATLLKENAYHLVIVGNADTASGRRTVETIKSAFPWLEVIAMVSSEGTQQTSGLIEAGAQDCLPITCAAHELGFRIKKALEHGRMKQELTNLRQQVAMSYGFDNIVGISKPVLKLKETIARVAPTDISILITGPSGSGKELLAKVIHHHSTRRKGNFVIVDCASIPESLFEMELFGEGADSSASDINAKSCLLMEADGGTVYFDDIDRLPPSIQPRLMNFLKSFSIRPAGQTETTKIDVRVISASSKNMEALVEEGCFSKELFYQLSVLPLSIPGLAQRAEDIEMLTEYFLRRLSHEMNRPMIEVSRRALDLLVGYTWPGNVRELENTLKRATALCRNNCIDADDILFIGAGPEQELAEEPVDKAALQRKTGLLDEGQRSIIIKALSENNWNFTQTAQELGIGRTTLWRKVKKYNLKREKVVQ